MNRNKRGKKGTASVNVEKQISSRIPYLRCYEQSGLIEIEPNKYSVTYIIEPPEHNQDILYVKVTAYTAMRDILIGLKDFTYRFTIRNANISVEDYLQQVLIPVNNNFQYNNIIEEYNQVLKDNVTIGHNNNSISVYLSLVTDADTPEEAIVKFDNVSNVVKDGFNSLYGYQARLLSLPERLHVLFDIYHPDEDDEAFGEKVNYDGNGFSITAMKRMQMTTKDVIAPKFYQTFERDYMRVGDKFVRTLFINTIPQVITDSLFSDLISVSSNSIISVSYFPIDTQYGFQTAAKAVKDNTDVKNVPIRETLDDRKNRRMERKESMKNETETEYFNKTALSSFADSVAKTETTMLVTFVIVLYADTLEDLERDTGLLRISANKYNCQVKTLDWQQHEGFVSALPLGTTAVDVVRHFSTERLSKLLPVDLHRLFETDVMLQGLNGINDNFVFVDRKYSNLGLIAGMDHSGKSFTLKREIVNSLISTDDTVIVISPDTIRNQYEDFIKEFDGQIHEAIYTDLFSCDTDYGLMKTNKELKRMFLEAFVTLQLGFNKQRYISEEMKVFYDEVEAEVAEICEYDDFVKAISETKTHAEDYKLFNKAVAGYMPTTNYPNLNNGRLHWFNFATPAELLLMMDYFWNFVITSKKSNKNVSIFIDGIDDLLYSPMSSDYLIAILERCKALKTPVTAVVQHSVKVVTHDVAKIEFEYLLEKLDYFKLFTQGIIERKFYADKLHIPNALVPYITDKEPGTGIIITPSMAVSFSDKFETIDNPFYKHFIN